MEEVWRGKTTTSPTQPKAQSRTIQHHRAPGAATPDPAAWGPRYPINAVELSSCQDQTDWQCSSNVQQLDRLTSDLHRPDMTL